MHLPEQEQRFADFKTGNGHVWQLDSNTCIVIYCVAYQLVMLLGKYIHWSCELIDLHIPSCVKLSSMYLISSVKCNCACLFYRLILVAVLLLFLATIHGHRLHTFHDAMMLCAHTRHHLTCGAESNSPFISTTWECIQQMLAIACRRSTSARLRPRML